MAKSKSKRPKKITKAQRKRCRKAHPGWTVRRVKSGKAKGRAKCMRPSKKR